MSRALYYAALACGLVAIVFGVISLFESSLDGPGFLAIGVLLVVVATGEIIAERS